MLIYGRPDIVEEVVGGSAAECPDTLDQKWSHPVSGVCNRMQLQAVLKPLEEAIAPSYPGTP